MAKKKTAKGGQAPFSEKKYIRERARKLEIGTCYRTTDMFEYGEGHVIVTRRHTGGNVTVGFYLVDLYCVGVKDTYYHFGLDPLELDGMIEHYGMFETCSYEEAHNLIYGAIEFAEEAGIKPHKDFALTQYILEEDDENVPLIEYEFGRDGRHFLMVHTRLEASRYLPLLNKNLGEGNFDYIIGNEDPDTIDYLDDQDE